MAVIPSPDGEKADEIPEVTRADDKGKGKETRRANLIPGTRGNVEKAHDASYMGKNKRKNAVKSCTDLSPMQLRA